VDRIATLPVDEYGNRIVEIRPEDAIAALRPPQQPDRQIRRFIARCVHSAYARGTLREDVILDRIDMDLMGASYRDLIRNCQVLEDEGYLVIGSTSSAAVSVRPTARLVRDVERYGAAREDVVSERDFLGAVSAYGALRDSLETIQLEYRRYSVALSETELQCVFRAIAPVVESVVKDLLRAHGSTANYATLGPAISDLQARGIGGVSLLSQLNHILKFARDQSQHGASLPVPVLRIACENAFELLPQLAALFPTQVFSPTGR
jgi:hypothetical protein